jgi:hypothetical protein
MERLDSLDRGRNGKFVLVFFFFPLQIIRMRFLSCLLELSK